MKRCHHVRAAGIVRDGRVLCSACEWERADRAERRRQRGAFIAWLVLAVLAAFGTAGMVREACRAPWGWP